MALGIPTELLPLEGCGETITVDGAEVAGVLVSPPERQASELSDIALPAGARLEYRLDFPKSFTADLMGKTAVVRGDEVRIIGKPVAYDDELTPGGWNRPAWAYVLEGDWSAEVRVLSLVATLDGLGDPVTVREAVYEGPAQARMSSGIESGGTDAQTVPSETWEFVVPRSEELAALRPQSTEVDYGGATYDARSIRDNAPASDTVTIEAVRHG